MDPPPWAHALTLSGLIDCDFLSDSYYFLDDPRPSRLTAAASILRMRISLPDPGGYTTTLRAVVQDFVDALAAVRRPYINNVLGGLMRDAIGRAAREEGTENLRYRMDMAYVKCVRAIFGEDWLLKYKLLEGSMDDKAMAERAEELESAVRMRYQYLVAGLDQPHTIFPKISVCGIGRCAVSEGIMEPDAVVAWRVSLMVEALDDLAYDLAWWEWEQVQWMKLEADKGVSKHVNEELEPYLFDPADLVRALNSRDVDAVDKIAAATAMWTMGRDGKIKTKFPTAHQLLIRNA